MICFPPTCVCMRASLSKSMFELNPTISACDAIVGSSAWGAIQNYFFNCAFFSDLVCVCSQIDQ